jgi:hypothetical protein
MPGMLLQLFLGTLLSIVLVAAQADSNVVAVMLVGRHGDRTSKVQGNTKLTTLGKNQVFNTGSYFRSRYMNASSPNYIQDTSPDYAANQIYASTPYK